MHSCKINLTRVKVQLVKGSKSLNERRRDSKMKKQWHHPELEELGNLSKIIKTTNPGKSDFGTDGMGGGGGEEMFML